MRIVSPRIGRGHANRHRGSATLELVLVLPMLLMSLLAVVQFGFFYVNMQQLPLGSRVGAEQASQTPGLNATVTGNPIPAEILEAIDAQLSSSGIEPCTIRLEHNLTFDGTPAVLTWTQGTGCDCPSIVVLPISPGGHYTRVTVCVAMTEVMPNHLIPFCVNPSGQTVQSTSIFRYED